VAGCQLAGFDAGAFLLFRSNPRAIVAAQGFSGGTFDTQPLDGWLLGEASAPASEAEEQCTMRLPPETERAAFPGDSAPRFRVRELALILLEMRTTPSSTARARTEEVP